MHWRLDDLTQLHDLLNVLEEKDDVDSSNHNLEDISPTIPITDDVDEAIRRGTLTAPLSLSPPPLISFETNKPYSQYVIKSGKMYSYGTSLNSQNSTSNLFNTSYPIWQPIFQTKSCEPVLQTINTTISAAPPIQTIESTPPYNNSNWIRETTSTLTSYTASTCETRPTTTVTTNSTFNNACTSEFNQPSMNSTLPYPSKTYGSCPNPYSPNEPIMQPLKWHNFSPLPVTSSVSTVTKDTLPLNVLPYLTPRTNFWQNRNTLSDLKNESVKVNSTTTIPSVCVKPRKTYVKYVKTKHLGEIELKIEEDADRDWYVHFYRYNENKLWCETMKPRRGLRAGRLGTKPAVTNYECMMCDDVLSCFQSLMSHLNLHLHLTPFLCDICKKSYASGASLTRHVRNKHGITKRCSTKACPSSK